MTEAVDPVLVTLYCEGDKTCFYITAKSSEGLKLSPSKVEEKGSGQLNNFKANELNRISTIEAVQFSISNANYICVAQHQKTIKGAIIYSAVFKKDTGEKCFTVHKVMQPVEIEKSDKNFGTLQLGHAFDSKGNKRLFMFFHTHQERKELYYDANILSLNHQWLNGPLIPLKDVTLFSNGIITGMRTQLPCTIKEPCIPQFCMIDLNHVTINENSHACFGPYTIKTSATSKVVTVGAKRNNRSDLKGTGVPVDVSIVEEKIVYSKENMQNFELEDSESYTFILQNGMTMTGENEARRPVALHSKTPFTAYAPSSRLTLPALFVLPTSSENFQTLRMHNGLYLAVYRAGRALHIQVHDGVTHNSQIKKVEGAIVDFSNSGDVVSIKEKNNHYYILTTSKSQNDAGHVHNVWQFNPETSALIGRRTLNTPASYLKVFIEFHSSATRSFTKIKHEFDVCIGTVFDNNDYYTCTCAGDSTLTNRLSDVFCGQKVKYFEDWEAVHNNACVPKIEHTDNDAVPVYVL